MEKLSLEQTIEEFEKRLVGSPNSSLLWTKYMSTALKLVDLAKARKIAERAIQTISFREEEEKMNIWVAYLNLENLYGTPESMKKVFERSVMYCDPRTMYMQLARIYIHNEKRPEAEQVFQTILKKFGQSCKVWVAYAEFLFPQDIGAARKLLPAALKTLPKRKRTNRHKFALSNFTDAKITMKFAQMEYRSGSVERGRTLLEGVLANYPKRIDIWSIYMTMEENICKKNAAENKEFLRYHPASPSAMLTV